jgi:hypothetical protein
MFNRLELVKITGLTEGQIRRLDEIQILIPKKNGRGTDAQYTYNDVIFVCTYGIIRGVLKELGFGLVELNNKFIGGLGSEIDFVNSDIFFFTRACFFLIPSSENAKAIYQEWIGNKPFDILPNVTSKHLQMFGLNVFDGLLMNALVLNLDTVKTQIKTKCKELAIEHKIPQLPKKTKANIKQKISK